MSALTKYRVPIRSKNGIELLGNSNQTVSDFARSWVTCEIVFVQQVVAQIAHRLISDSKADIASIISSKGGVSPSIIPCIAW